eukprot:8108355-Pyramimonas_sp.AAC.1
MLVDIAFSPTAATSLEGVCYLKRCRHPEPQQFTERPLPTDWGARQFAHAFLFQRAVMGSMQISVASVHGITS